MSKNYKSVSGVTEDILGHYLNLTGMPPQTIDIGSYLLIRKQAIEELNYGLYPLGNTKPIKREDTGVSDTRIHPPAADKPIELPLIEEKEIDFAKGEKEPDKNASLLEIMKRIEG